MEPSLFGTLVVIFIKARNLPNRRTLGKQNPYCIARIGQDAKRSPSDVRGGQVPSWDHEVRFEVMDVTEQRTMKLSVLDENDSKPELIGDTMVVLDDALSSHPSKGYDRWHELQFKGKYAGEVYLEMTFYAARPALPPKKRISMSSKNRSSVHSSMSNSGSRSSMAHPSQLLPMHLPDESMPSSPRPLPGLPYPVENDSPARASTMQMPAGPAPPLHRASSSFDIGRPIHSSMGKEPPRPSSSAGYHRPSWPNSPGFVDSGMGRPMSAAGGPPAPPAHGSPGRMPAAQYGAGSPRADFNSPLPKRKPVGMSSAPGTPDASRSPARRKPVPGYGGSPNVAHRFEDANKSLGPMPFSPDSYESSWQQENRFEPEGFKGPQNGDQLDFATYAPEPVLKPKRLPAVPGSVDPGLGGYNGEGQWDISKQINEGYGDSIFNKVTSNPKLPPKIPLGMTRAEFAAIEPKEEEDPYYYRDYH